MSHTRRDFLKFATAGAGSLAAIGLGSETASACCWNDSVRGITMLRPIVADINITSPANSTIIGRSFTVMGRFYDAPQNPPIECKLFKMSGGPPIIPGTVSTFDTYWMANFTIPSDAMITSSDQLTVKADLLGTQKTDSIINLTLASDNVGGSGSPPIVITNPGSQFVRAHDPLKLLATPEGEVYEPTITTVHIRYVQAGRPMVGEYPINVVNDNGKRKWKKWKFDFSNHAGEDKISFLVRATSTGGLKYALSEHGLSVEGS